MGIGYHYIAGAFDDDDVTHVEGDVNPVRDLEIISEELRLKDQQYLSKNIVSYIMLWDGLSLVVVICSGSDGEACG